MVKKCELNNWIKNIPNKELVKNIYNTYKNVKNVKFKHIKAHTNNIDIHSIGNNEADKLAQQALGIKPINKIYLCVPFSRKEEIKKLGGRWDSRDKK